MTDFRNFISIKTNDNITTKVEKKFLTKCDIFNKLFEDEQDNEQEDISVFLLNAYNNTILDIFIKYCVMHENIPHKDIRHPITNDIYMNDISQKDRVFMKNLDTKPIYELINLANFVGNNELLELCSAIIAFDFNINNDSVDTLRQKLNIVNDFTEEEEEQIRKDNAWCEDD